MTVLGVGWWRYSRGTSPRYKSGLEFLILFAALFRYPLFTFLVHTTLFSHSSLVLLISLSALLQIQYTRSSEASIKQHAFAEVDNLLKVICTVSPANLKLTS